MRGKKTHEIVYQMVQPLVGRRGWELVAVEYVKEAGNWYLRIYIDKDGGIDLDDCQALSREVSDLLDENDPIPQAYFLEVSSPGIERLIQTEKDFQRFRGRKVVVHTYVPVEGQKKIEGELGAVDDENLELKDITARTILIPRVKIAQVRLAWEE